MPPAGRWSPQAQRGRVAPEDRVRAGGDFFSECI